MPYKLFNRDDVLDEIQQVGFYCIFQPCADQLKEYPLDDIILVADPDEQYGANWYAAVTEDAFNRELKVFKDKEEAERQEKLRLEEEERQRKIAAEIEAQRIYEVMPLTTREYKSETEENTIENVKWLTIKSQRPLLSYTIARKRSEFCAPYTFNDVDPETCDDFRKHIDPDFANNLNRMERETCLQIGPSYFSLKKDKACQSQLARLVNSSVQYETRSFDQNFIEEQLKSKELSLFLDRAVPLVRSALQSNETVDVFKNELDNFPEDGLSLGNQAENQISEFRVFTDLDHSKGRIISHIRWHPRRKGVVMCSVNEKLTFEEKRNKSVFPSSSYILVWSFEDLIHPMMILKSPVEINSFIIHPENPDTVIVGGASGQVMMYNLAQNWAEKEREKQKGPRDPLEDPLHSQYLDPIVYSSSEKSHSKAVTALHWIKSQMEVNTRGQINKKDTREITQFMSCSIDGQINVWDLNYKEIAKRSGLYRYKDDEEVPWVPRFNYMIDCSSEVGSLAMTRFIFGDPNETDSTIFRCVSEMGVIASGDLNQLDGEVPSYVRWHNQDHLRPVKSLERSPFISNVYLTVSSWSFHIYMGELQDPVFISPRSQADFTIGRWSPTRPGVLYVGRTDGYLEVWDFTDQSSSASIIHPITSGQISSMEFRLNSDTGRQLIAVGDSNGNLYILSIPISMRRQVNNEVQIIQSHFERESQRVHYIDKITEHIEKVNAFKQKDETRAEAKKTDEMSEEQKRHMELDRMNGDYRRIEIEYLTELGLINPEEDKNNKNKRLQSSEGKRVDTEEVDVNVAD